MNDTLMTVKEAAEYLKLSEFTVRKLCRTGKITAVKYPGAKMWRIPRMELEKMIENRSKMIENRSKMIENRSK
jgi:excisionase family DNA binding protein